MSAYANDDYGSGGSAYASVTANENIEFIDWYIKSDPIGDYEYSSTTVHGNTKNVNEYLGSFSGESKGSKYGVKAVVSFEESSDEDVTDTFRVFRPASDPQNGRRTDPPSKTGADGYAYVYRHYCNGSAIVMEGAAYAYNLTNNDKAIDPNNNPMEVEIWFRVIQYDEVGNQIGNPRIDLYPIETIEVGETSEYRSPDNMKVGIPLGEGGIEEGEELHYDAHTHLRVYIDRGVHKEDNWEADSGIQTFTSDDNP